MSTFEPNPINNPKPGKDNTIQAIVWINKYEFFYSTLGSVNYCSIENGLIEVKKSKTDADVNRGYICLDPRDRNSIIYCSAN